MNMDWKVEKDFYCEGYRCVVVMTSMCHRCGYVGIPEGHYLYKKNYIKDKCLRFSDISKGNQGKRGKRGFMPLVALMFSSETELVSPDVYFDVHGSITYAASDNEYPVENKNGLWFFGFDCGHAGDKKSPKDAYAYGLITDKQLKYFLDLDSKYSIENEEERTADYVEQECISLAKQLKKVENYSLKEDEHSCV